MKLPSKRCECGNHWMLLKHGTVTLVRLRWYHRFFLKVGDTLCCSRCTKMRWLAWVHQNEPQRCLHLTDIHDRSEEDRPLIST